MREAVPEELLARARRCAEARGPGGGPCGRGRAVSAVSAQSEGQDGEGVTGMRGKGTVRSIPRSLGWS